jgi:hypothetical protein
MLARFLALHAQQQAQQQAQDAAGVTMTLEQAIAEQGRQQHATQIKNWYKQGYYKKTNGLWYSSVGGKERRKYSTV